jgi:hypothetical protein
MFDCSVRPNPTTGELEVDFSAYDTVFNCPLGTLSGLYMDEDDFSKVRGRLLIGERATSYW